jgi:hypothetical protein
MQLALLSGGDAAGFSVQGVMQLASVSWEYCSWHQCRGSDASRITLHVVMQLSSLSRE